MQSTQELITALKKHFGYDSFRLDQEAIIKNVLHGTDTFVLMPTGGGKSICYQLPALLMEGLTVVVSPLIALMKDQVETLKANGVAAAFLNSSLTAKQQFEIENQALNGEIKLLYVSPEKAVSGGFFSFLRSAKTCLFAIDEAHCISSWGHDFRPEYAQLALLKEQFPAIPVIALTATADKVTRQDIIDRLRLDQPKTFLTSFNRPNIELRVAPGKKRLAQIIDFISKRPHQSGIVYCLSRKSTESLAQKLQAEGIKAGYYHAGMSAEERSVIQTQFQRDQLPIICATVAFGMGIDKPNVRWVIHYNLPKNMESYYQEIGRGGRDGLPAEALLFYSFSDVIRLQQMVEESGQRELGLAKLQRIQEYAEARTCRRKILLSYFGEHLPKDCGNCDVCQSPPQTFDGTVIAQKALSAVYRLKEQVAAGMLIDVLRGSRRSDLVEKGYDKIKTYGKGKDLSSEDWQQFLLQLMHQGLVEIAYNEHQALKLTEASKAVLFEKQLVRLIQPQKYYEKKEPVTEYKPQKTKGQALAEALFEELRNIRKQLADEQNVPAFVIFGDKSLLEMAEKRPITTDEFAAISGVGQQKLQQYGKVFIEAIITFIARKTAKGEKVKHGTHLYSWKLFQAGKTLEQIATLRKIAVDRLYEHLDKALSFGLPVDLERVLTKKEAEEIVLIFDSIGEDRLKPTYEALKEKYPYGVIRLVLSYRELVGEV